MKVRPKSKLCSLFSKFLLLRYLKVDAEIIAPASLNDTDQFHWLLTNKMINDETKLSALKESVDTNGDYINCDFIQGTAVENESIWSMATTILCNNRAGMTPVWFETILFLKYNNEIWENDKKLFMKALQNHRKNDSEKNNNRIVKRNADLLKSLGISDEQASNLDLLIEDDIL